MAEPSGRDRLILALDFDSVQQAEKMISTVEGEINFFKIGLELAYAGGLELARDLRQQGFGVFMDLKLHDIGNQVSRAAERVADLGANLLTVHAYPKTMRAAREALAGTRTQVIGVTVLTSMNDQDLSEAGYAFNVQSLVQRRIEQAREASIAGVVCSPIEAKMARDILGPEGVVVTPGIRMPEGDKGDQIRVATPASAIQSGASHIVVGRPIRNAGDPKATAKLFQAEISLVS